MVLRLRRNGRASGSALESSPMPGARLRSLSLCIYIYMCLRTAQLASDSGIFGGEEEEEEEAVAEPPLCDGGAVSLRTALFL